VNEEKYGEEEKMRNFFMKRKVKGSKFKVERGIFFGMHTFFLLTLHRFAPFPLHSREGGLPQARRDELTAPHKVIRKVNLFAQSSK
jgi:hypothetical protein